jgi:hypothetical protein
MQHDNIWMGVHDLSGFQCGRKVSDRYMHVVTTDHHFHFLLDYKSELYIDIINIINRYI